MIDDIIQSGDSAGIFVKQVLKTRIILKLFPVDITLIIFRPDFKSEILFMGADVFEAAKEYGFKIPDFAKRLTT